MWLTLAKRVEWFWAVAIIVALLVTLRMVVPLAGFVVASVLRLSLGERLKLGDTFLALAREIWARALSFTLVQPFEKWLMADEPYPRSRSASVLPVLLLHGYVCNRGVWRAMRRKLAARLPNQFFSINLETPFASVEHYVPQLAAKVEEICALTKMDRVVVVAHSLGGLVSRAYIARGAGRTRIAKLITLGSPHHGTKMAPLGIGHNALQMRYGNDWLAQLATQERKHPRGVPLTCLYTENDDLVCPSESGRLPGAKNIVLRAVGHVSLLFSTQVAELVAEEIRTVNN